MTKTIKKQHRTDGVFNSNNFTDLEKIERESKQNNKY